MNNDRPIRKTISLEEATVSNMWEIVALVQVLERNCRIIEMGQRVAKGTIH